MQDPIWYHTDLAGEQRGPVTADEVRAGIERGDIPANARFWREGLVDWVGLDSVAAELGVAPPPPPPASSRASFDLGRDPTPTIAPALERAPVDTAPAEAAPVDPYAAPRVVAAAPYGNDIVYAGFLRRAAAYVIDELIVILPLVLLFVLVAVAAASATGSGGADQVAGVLVLLAYPAYYTWKAVYYAGQEASVHQATLGKRLLGIKVTDDTGQRLSFGHALGRWFASALSHVTFYVGFLMAAFTDRKRALHDMVAGTLVVDKWAYTDHPERQKRETSGCLIVLVIVGAMIPILAILAAISVSQYQDYVAKSQFMEAPAIADGLKTQVAEAYVNTGECPVNGEAGFAAAEEYSGRYVERIDIGGTAPNCVITARFRGEDVAMPLRYATAVFTGTNAGGTFQWKCEAPGIADKYLPQSCRE